MSLVGSLLSGRLQYPAPPTLADAADDLARMQRSVRAKLDAGRQRPDAPAEWLADGERKLAKLAATTPEQRLEEMLRSHAAECQRIDAEARRAAWERFIAARGSRYAGCTLDNYAIHHDGQCAVVERLREYARHLPANYETGINVVLFGTCGTGKDHLLTALARIAIIDHGIGVRWTTGAELASSEREQQWPSRTFSGLVPHVVYISDPAPPGGAAAFRTANRLYSVIDQAYSDLRPVWVSLNAANRGQAVELLGAQLVDRLTDRGLVLKCEWPSYRQPIDF